jgi:hypothetical protein
MNEKGYCEYCLTKLTSHRVLATDGVEYYCCRKCERDFPNDSEE